MNVNIWASNVGFTFNERKNWSARRGIEEERMGSNWISFNYWIGNNNNIYVWMEEMWHSFAYNKIETLEWFNSLYKCVHFVCSMRCERWTIQRTTVLFTFYSIGLQCLLKRLHFVCQWNEIQCNLHHCILYENVIYCMESMMKKIHKIHTPIVYEPSSHAHTHCINWYRLRKSEIQYVLTVLKIWIMSIEHTHWKRVVIEVK